MHVLNYLASSPGSLLKKERAWGRGYQLPTLQTLSLPVKILVTKRPFDSTLENSTTTFPLAGNLNSKVAGQPRIVLLATEISITYIHYRKCLSYIEHEGFQGAYNNYDGLTFASVTSIMRQNSPMNADYRSRGAFSLKFSERWSVNQIRHVVIAGTRVFVDRDVITQTSTNQIHPTEIPRTSNFYVASLVS